MQRDTCSVSVSLLASSEIWINRRATKNPCWSLNDSGRLLSLASRRSQFSLSFAPSIGTPSAPSRLALHIPPSSAPKSSNFHTSTFNLHSSKASSPAFHAACLCGLATAMSILSSPIGTIPSRWTMLMAVKACFFFTAWAMSNIVLSARGA